MTAREIFAEKLSTKSAEEVQRVILYMLALREQSREDKARSEAVLEEIK